MELGSITTRQRKKTYKIVFSAILESNFYFHLDVLGIKLKLAFFIFPIWVFSESNSRFTGDYAKRQCIITSVFRYQLKKNAQFVDMLNRKACIESR
ncbi:MAG: hypothetical protein HC787_10045 [Nostocaceae cyanobacterium CSU_2_110]|nr:hypothetical protein [Nostocaceae cyanobacterium CSU_2_110]